MVKDLSGALAAALLGLVLAWRIADGSAGALVQSWYEPVLVAATLVLLVMSCAVALRATRSRERWRPALNRGALLSGGLIALPILVAVAMRPEPLGSANLAIAGDAEDGLRFSASAAGSTAAQRNLYQWAYEFQASPPATLLGQPVDVIAFVYHRDGVPAVDRFEAARFVVACCVADASGYTLPVQWSRAGDLASDSWVHITGRVATAPDGTLVVQATSVEPVDAPANPYIYP